MDDFDDDEFYIEEQFNNAIKFLPTIVSSLDDKKKLKFYSFYKQATEGSCNIPKPGYFNFQAKAKWEAWNELGNMNTIQAKKSYIDLLDEIDSSWIKKKVKGAVFVSRPIFDEDSNDKSEKTIFDIVKTGDLNEFKKQISLNSSLINEIDEEGLHLLHWAADRDHSEIVEFLLKSGVNVDQLDSMNQSALIYGAAGNNVKTVEILLKYNPKRDVKDEDGLTAMELTTDNRIKELLS